MKFTTYLGYTVVALMLIVSAFCFFPPKNSALLEGKNNMLLGSVFLVYALFRFYRIRVVAKRNQNLTQDDAQ